MQTDKVGDSSVLSTAFQTSTPLLFDIYQAARILGVPVWTLRRLIWAKQIPARKLNRKLFLSHSAIVDFAAGVGRMA